MHDCCQPAESPDPSHPSLVISPSRRRKVLLRLSILAAGGLAAAAIHASLIESGGRRFMLAYLTAFAFVLSLSLGALFFVLIQHLTRAGWSVLVRRQAEILSAAVFITAILFVPILVSVWRGHGELYPWAQPTSQVVHHELPVQPLLDADGALIEYSDPVIHPGMTLAADRTHQELTPFTMKKRAYLNGPFFTARWLVLLGIWIALGFYFWGQSVRQDIDRDPRRTRRLEKAAAPALLVLAITLTVAAFDLLMSLNPHWYSTIFGVYYFSGAVVGALAVLIIIQTILQKRGSNPIHEEHFLDLGRLLFAFVFFWAYIAFSQYMLLWYANVPEMTSWLRLRGVSTGAGHANAWSSVALLLLFGHFLVPFCVLMTRHTKRRPLVLAAIAAWMLIMHYIDLAWLVMPEFSAKLTLGAIEWGLLLAMCCLYLMGAIGLCAKRSLVAQGDPRLQASLAHEAPY